jgi:flagellar hook-basal body complex protein FliE
MSNLPIDGPGAAGTVAPQTGPASGAKRPVDRSFGETLMDALTSVEEGQRKAAEAVGRNLAGDGSDLHTVLLELEKADLAFRTMMEVRNKLIEAYREVMRMPM